MRRLLLMTCLICVPALSHAQTATPASRLVWDQPAGTLAEASGYTYEATWDGAPVVPLAGVTCAGTASPFVCAAAFPALTPTTHTVQVAARNAAGASPLSAVFSFTFVALPQAPRNLRITVGG